MVCQILLKADCSFAKPRLLIMWAEDEKLGRVVSINGFHFLERLEHKTIFLYYITRRVCILLNSNCEISTNSDFFFNFSLTLIKRVLEVVFRGPGYNHSNLIFQLRNYFNCYVFLLFLCGMFA